MTTYLVVAGLTRRLVESHNSEGARKDFVKIMENNGGNPLYNRRLVVARDDILVREATDDDKAEFGRKRRVKKVQEERLPMELPPLRTKGRNPT